MSRYCNRNPKQWLKQDGFFSLVDSQSSIEAVLKEISKTSLNLLSPLSLRCGLCPHGPGGPLSTLAVQPPGRIEKVSR